jgi:hypothetical protein
MVEESADATAAEADLAEAAPVNAETTPGTHPRYWLRVHGYPSDLSQEVVYYNDFYDLERGKLPGDPRENLQVGDVLIYFADGPASVYGVATVVGEVAGPFANEPSKSKWQVPIKREAIIKAVNKAPHAAWMEPPSGHHFLPVVRNYTYIRLPEEDGVYLVEQVRARASSRE